MNLKLEFAKQYLAVRLRHFRSRDQLLTWQNQQVRTFLKSTVPQSPFYSHHFEGHLLQNWETLPTVNKAIMMANFDGFNTVGLSKDALFEIALRGESTRDFSPVVKGFTVGLSSGTSGNRGLFLVSPLERQLWAAYIIAKLMPNAVFERHRIALFLRANSNVYTTLNSVRIQFAYFDLVQSPPEHLARLNDLQPTVLVAPPSMLRYLASAQEAGRLVINPRKIISGAEVLDPLDKRYIEAVFSQRLHQVYQATEGFLGCTCEKGTLHLNEDIVAVQRDVLDTSTGKFAPVITDFHRTTQPIIRYRLDDVLTEKLGRCECGQHSLALEHIEGRCDDVFYFPAQSGNGWVMVFPDFIRRAVMTSSDTIRAYQVEQTGPDQIIIRLDLPQTQEQQVHRALSDELYRLVQERGGHTPHITFEPLSLELPSTTKLRRVFRTFSIDPHIDGVI